MVKICLLASAAWLAVGAAAHADASLDPFSGVIAIDLELALTVVATPGSTTLDPAALVGDTVVIVAINSFGIVTESVDPPVLPDSTPSGSDGVEVYLIGTFSPADDPLVEPSTTFDAGGTLFTPPTPVPEPGSPAVFGIALCGFMALRRASR